VQKSRIGQQKSILLLLQGMAQVCRCIVCMRTGAWPKHMEDVEELEDKLLAEHEQNILDHGSEAVDVIKPEDRKND